MSARAGETYCEYSGKRIFPSAATARRCTRQLNIGSAYRCPHCRGFHVARRRIGDRQAARMRAEALDTGGLSPA